MSHSQALPIIFGLLLLIGIVLYDNNQRRQEEYDATTFQVQKIEGEAFVLTTDPTYQLDRHRGRARRSEDGRAIFTVDGVDYVEVSTERSAVVTKFDGKEKKKQ